MSNNNFSKFWFESRLFLGAIGLTRGLRPWMPLGIIRSSQPGRHTQARFKSNSSDRLPSYLTQVVANDMAQVPWLAYVHKLCRSFGVSMWAVANGPLALGKAPRCFPRASPQLPVRTVMPWPECKNMCFQIWVGVSAGPLWRMVSPAASPRGHLRRNTSLTRPGRRMQARPCSLYCAPSCPTQVISKVSCVGYDGGQ